MIGFKFQSLFSLSYAVSISSRSGAEPSLTGGAQLLVELDPKCCEMGSGSYSGSVGVDFGMSFLAHLTCEHKFFETQKTLLTHTIH